ncbi:hypothetical protein OOU_Y34scaffold00162g20 [Pyricularia oryzae Y34]|uniref:Uncharacterized protein n=2 Tax=Pyricularia oryzae TaxID=318829 RepID=A0AA97P719_PYRO3|nr:hypothetical protein OOU_Y34scaffold00162g20 [Pyricularia oryzae Y34]
MSAKKSRDELIKGEPSFIGFVDMSDHSRKSWTHQFKPL